MSVKFTPDSKGIAAFLKSPQVQAMVAEAAQTVRDRAGEGFDVRTGVGTRARASVGTATNAARRRQATDHVLERAVGGGG